jgi:hypothetical protein
MPPAKRTPAKTLSDQARDLIEAHGGPGQVARLCTLDEPPEHLGKARYAMERALQRFASGASSGISTELLEKIAAAIPIRLVEVLQEAPRRRRG